MYVVFCSLEHMLAHTNSIFSFQLYKGNIYYYLHLIGKNMIAGTIASEYQVMIWTGKLDNPKTNPKRLFSFVSYLKNKDLIGCIDKRDFSLWWYITFL